MSIDVKLLKQMIRSGTNAVVNEYAYIDKLNVFPIPDGDTGTNLKMTLLGAFDYINPVEEVEGLLKQYARGLLMNARGNSGAIMSQIFRGFAQGFAGKRIIDNPETVLKALESAKEVGYKSVLAPVEGTILTVIRLTAENMRRDAANFSTPEQVFAELPKYANEALQETPKLLKMLEDAKVVDSGGYGLWKLLDGFALALKGQPVELKKKSVTETSTIPLSMGDEITGEADYGYCCEFIVKLSPEQNSAYDEEKFKRILTQRGESIVSIRDEDIVKVHMHSLYPSKVLEAGQKIGEFQKIKIENMNLQSENLIIVNQNQVKEAQRQEREQAQAPARKETIRRRITSRETTSAVQKSENGCSVVATVPSREVGELLVKNYGIDNYIDQSKVGNPSTKNFVDVFNHIKNKNIILLTDNGNILMSANAAIKLSRHSNIYLVAAKTIIETMAAALVYDPFTSVKHNVRRMRNEIKKMSTGFVSVSVKDIRYDEILVRKNEFVGLSGKKVVAGSKNLDDVVGNLVKSMLVHDSDATRLQVILGTTTTPTMFEKIEQRIKRDFPQLDIEEITGNIPVYNMVIGLR